MKINNIFATLSVTFLAAVMIVTACTPNSEAASYDSDGLLYETYGDVAGVIGCTDTTGTDIVVPSSVTLGGSEYNVTWIGDDVFSGNKSIVSITLPEGIVQIGEHSFIGCSSLKSINIPSSVYYIGEFTLNSPHIYVDVDVNNPMFMSVNGTMFNKDGTELIKYYDDGNQYTIPDGVDRISPYAFFSCNHLQSVVIPSGVVEIGGNAFSDCSSLSEVSMESRLSVITYDCFSNCTSLQTIKIPDTVTEIQNSAFSECESLRNITVPEGVTSLGQDVFFACTSLESVDLPSTLTSMETSIFSECHNLKTVKLPPGLKTIGGHMFSRSGLKYMKIPDSVTSIGDSAFYDCKELTNIVFPSGLTSLGKNCFKACIRLTEVSIPEGVTEIPENAFSMCVSIRSLTIPGSVNEYGPGAFEEIRIFDVDKEITDMHRLSGATFTGEGNGKLYLDGIKPQRSVTFESEGETVAIVSGEQGSLLELPEDPRRDGFKFVEWNPAPPTFIPEDDTTVYAIWEKIESEYFRIIFDTDGGPDIDPVVQAEGTELSVNISMQRDGYRFVRWTPSIPSVMPDHDLTVKAVWEKAEGKEYTLRFDTGDGSAVPSETFREGSAVSMDTHPYLEGYTFERWEPEIPDVMPGHDITVKAVWSENPVFRAMFLSNGVVIADLHLRAETAIPVPDVPLNEGEMFAGWMPAVPKLMPFEDVEYTAVILSEDGTVPEDDGSFSVTDAVLVLVSALFVAITVFAAICIVRRGRRRSGRFEK